MVTDQKAGGELTELGFYPLAGPADSPRTRPTDSPRDRPADRAARPAGETGWPANSGRSRA